MHNNALSGRAELAYRQTRDPNVRIEERFLLLSPLVLIKVCFAGGDKECRVESAPSDPWADLNLSGGAGSTIHSAASPAQDPLLIM